MHSGSRAVGTQDTYSDIDLYVYSREPVPLTARHALIRRRTTRMEIGNHVAEENDFWTERDSGVQVGTIYRPAASFENHVIWLLGKFEVRRGNSTAVWHNLLTSCILFDREGWVARLQERAFIALNVTQLRGACLTQSRSPLNLNVLRCLA